jgi:predicted transcriptional regulator
MNKDKTDVMDLIRRLPDDVTTADIMDELYFKQQVDQGLRDLAEGSVLTHQELRERLAKWRKSVGH